MSRTTADQIKHFYVFVVKKSLIRFKNLWGDFFVTDKHNILKKGELR